MVVKKERYFPRRLSRPRLQTEMDVSQRTTPQTTGKQCDAVFPAHPV